MDTAANPPFALVISDEDGVQMCELLVRKGYLSSVRTNVHEALSYLEVIEPDLIVLAHVRAQGDFRKLLQRLRMHPRVMVLEDTSPLRQLAKELERLTGSTD